MINIQKKYLLQLKGLNGSLTSKVDVSNITVWMKLMEENSWLYSLPVVRIRDYLHEKTSLCRTEENDNIGWETWQK